MYQKILLTMSADKSLEKNMVLASHCNTFKQKRQELFLQISMTNFLHVVIVTPEHLNDYYFQQFKNWIFRAEQLPWTHQTIKTLVKPWQSYFYNEQTGEPKH